MSIQTRNKRKDWQPELGIKAHKVICKRPSSGHSGTKCRASREQVTGTHYPYSRHRVPKVPDDFWALPASRRLRYYAWCFMTILWWFDDGLVILLWQFHDTSITFMILLVKKSEKYHSCILLYISYLYHYLTQKMILWDFFHKKNFSRVRINSTLNLKRIWYNTL